VADQTSTDVASAVLVAGGILLILVLRVGLRLLHGRMRWLTMTATVLLFVCAVAYFIGAGSTHR
jgi:hypothetical protein